MIRGIVFLFLFCCSLVCTGYLYAQQGEKEVNQQVQFWTSINTLARVSDKWGIVGDFHIRRNNFIKDPSFYFIRFGANYWVKKNFTLVGGYGHMWLASAAADDFLFTNENRIYEQAQVSSKWGKVSVLNRLRNEQRWRQKLIDGEKSDQWGFSNRVRYLLSFTFPVFSNPKAPSLVLADELLVQFGKDIVYNTFDQNRLFLGMKQNLSKVMSMDFGYMLVYQQKGSGYQYDMNHTIRLFFYYTPNWTIRHHERSVLEETGE